MTGALGFVGLRFIDSTLDKTVALRELRKEVYQYVIEIGDSSNRKSLKKLMQQMEKKPMQRICR